jgi:agmatine deiminase
VEQVIVRMANVIRKLVPSKGSPAADGYIMPAEWEQHTATWLAWPHNGSDWPGKFTVIPWVFADIIKHLSTDEIVHLLVNDNGMAEKARRVLRKHGVNLEAVRFHEVPTDRIWTRDSGPIFVKNGQDRLAVTNWHFNAWAKYDNWTKDDLVPEAAARSQRLKQYKPVAGAPRRRVVLEGGSIDVNGAGLLLTTEECLLSEVQQRNPGLAREQIEQVMADYLGIKKVLWLKNGIAGDDTHGHVDDLARFTDRNTIVVAAEQDKSDANFEYLRENLELLRGMRNLQGKPFRVVTLPMPAPVVFDGQRLPASYANFYIANGKVLVPTFNDANDRIALGILQKLFPSRRVIGIHCLDLVWGLGTLHCMTQQQPA